jgi:hypothetical protein
MSQRKVTPAQGSGVRVFTTAGFAGALIGGLQGMVGYFPHVNCLLMTVSGVVVGSVAAGILGLGLYFAAFRSCDAVAVIRSIAWVSGVCGVLASLGFRWWTFGEGAVLSMFVTPIVAVIAAAAIRAYIEFGRRVART